MSRSTNDSANPVDTATDYRRDAWISAIVLGAILLVVFWPFLIGDKSLLSSAADVPSLYIEGAAVAQSAGHLRSLDPGAAGWQTEPAFAYSHHVMFQEHRLPFWDPDGGYGKPSLGAMVPQQFYPPSTIVTLHPSPRTQSWWAAGRLFIAAFFSALFVRLFFASRWAAIGAGIAAMFTGYFLLYYDMPHLSVEVELPMLLWATESVSRKVSPRRVAALAAAVGLVILGGMPESAFLALTVASLYALLRLVTLPGERLNRIAALASALVLGLALGSIELVPFLELMRNGASTHDASMQQGLAVDGPWQNGLLTELIPRAFGSPLESFLPGSLFSGVRGFFGVSGFLLGMVAVCSAVLKRDRRTVIVAFLALLALYSILKRYGNPAVNWTGALPFFVQIQFVKYIEAVLGTVVALLVGFGVGYLRERRRDGRAVWIAFGCTVFLITILFLHTRAFVPVGPAANIYPHELVFGLFFLLVLAGAAGYATSENDRLRFFGSATIIAILVAEPFVTYLYPVIIRPAPPKALNPYGSAPYISYLQKEAGPTHARLFGTGGMLFPNWASAYDLTDTRSIEAVTLRDFLPFVNTFIAKTPSTSGDQFDRFVGTRPIDMESPLVHRWFALSSVGFIISPDAGGMQVAPKRGVLDDLVKQAEGQVPAADLAAVHRASAEVGGIDESAFFEHPPRDITFHTVVTRAEPRLLADLALDPSSYEPAPLCGGPVTFTLRAFRDGTAVGSASRTIDPKHVLADRHWMPLSIDLSRSVGRALDIHFQTSAADTCAAWALWGEPRFVPSGERDAYRQNQFVFPLAYRAPGVDIFRVPDSLSRFTIYHRAQSVASFKDAVSALTSPAFNVHNQVVVEGPVPPLAAATGRDSITVTFMRSDEVTASVIVGSAGLLMQNDSFYPGWKATIDGREVPILKADGFFRGIPVDAGRHTVVITYQSGTALAGTLLSLAGTIVFAVLLIDPIPLLRRRTAAA